MSFKDQVDKGQIEFGGLPFWSWNDKLEEGELRLQIRVMHKLGMHGFFMHARGGLETDYLSEDWFSAVKACIDEAGKLGMEAWSYDENGWPSGFGGGKVLLDPLNFASYIKYSVSSDFPLKESFETDAPEDKVLCVYVKDGDSFVRVFSPLQNDATYYVVTQKYDSSYVDVLDPAVIAEFIRVTHEDYKNRLGDSFGKTMPGFFTDEPQYYRYATPWSNTLPQKFRAKYGYDIFDGLIALFADYPGACEFRYDYYYLCHELFTEAFPKQIYEWLDANGAMLTGHAVEEAYLAGQMWSCGGVMPFYEYEHIPGMDYLGRGIASDLAPKQLGSVASQLGKKKVLTETFACCGWDVSPRELKKIADLQYSAGINVMCQHLYAYSIRGQRKRDYPANYSEHLPWQNAFGDFVKYYDRLGYTLSMGSEAVDTLVIHPMHSAYLTYNRETDLASVADLEDGLNRIMNFLGDRQIPYHFGDEVILRRHGHVKGDTISVGNMTYKYVLLPRIYSLDTSTAELIREYIGNGGRILLFDNVPDRIDGRIADLSWLRSNISISELTENRSFVIDGEESFHQGVKFMMRNTSYGRLYYVTNVSDNDYKDLRFTFKDVDTLFELNLEEGEWNCGNGISRVSGGRSGRDIVFETDLLSSGSKLFIERVEDCCVSDSVCAGVKERTSSPEADAAKTLLGGEYKLSSVPENQLTLDYASISKDGVTFDEEKPIIQIFDELLRSRYDGKLYVKYSFCVKEIPDSLLLVLEPLKYDLVNINGLPAAAKDGFRLDRSFKIYDIVANTRVGRNEVLVSFDYYQREYVYEVLYGNVMESLRNCLSFDTELEAAYLYGDFAVETPSSFVNGPRNSLEYSGDLLIKRPPHTVDLNDLVTCGYPFFAGKITVEKDLDGSLVKDGTLTVEGRYSYCDVYVNDIFVKRLMFKDNCNIKDFVRQGSNTLKLILCNSNRNLLGPHHFIDPEPYVLGPVNFSLENMWHDGHCDLFVSRYAFVRYGASVSVS